MKLLHKLVFSLKRITNGITKVVRVYDINRFSRPLFDLEEFLYFLIFLIYTYIKNRLY